MLLDYGLSYCFDAQPPQGLLPLQLPADLQEQQGSGVCVGGGRGVHSGR